MYLGKIVGQIEASRRCQGLQGHRLVIVQPLDFNRQPIRWTLIATDVTNATLGSLIAFEEGREAANPYEPPLPVDACVVAQIESFDYRP